MTALNILGILFGMAGVIWYSEIKMREQQQKEQEKSKPKAIEERERAKEIEEREMEREREKILDMAKIDDKTPKELV